MKFGELLKSRREKPELSLTEVAKQVGISKGHLHDLEHERQLNPSLITTMKLSAALSVSIESLVVAMLNSIVVRDYADHKLPEKYKGKMK